MHSLSAQHRKWHPRCACRASVEDARPHRERVAKARVGTTPYRLSHLGRPSFSLESGAVANYKTRSRAHLKISQKDNNAGESDNSEEVSSVGLVADGDAKV